jgi:hypothetical protein
VQRRVQKLALDPERSEGEGFKVPRSQFKGSKSPIQNSKFKIPVCIPPQTPDTPTHSGISEAVLAAIWNEQSYLRGPMWCCDGEPVAVVYRGRWTAGSGPDFESAILSLGEGGSRLITGSVEMHLQCGDWWAHGHDRDPRYNSVALHVVLRPNGARPVTRADGVSVPTLVLADYITLPTSELLERVTPLVGGVGTLSEEPCWKRTENWPTNRLLEPIEAAGDARLRSKATALEADLHVLDSPDDVFYEGLMDALGYSANREPMRALASALPISQLLLLPLGKELADRVRILESVLLGGAGLLPSQRPGLGEMDWESAQYAEEVEALWDSHSHLLTAPRDGVPNLEWNTERVRPANSPTRRLAAAARILARLLWEEGGMLGPFLRARGDTPAALGKTWTRLLTVQGDGYWGAHSDFGRELGDSARSKEEIALVGSSRASDIVVNILLPLMLALGDFKNELKLGDRAAQVYAVYPKLDENRITKQMAEEALGPRKKAINTARRQQGLIHLYRLYCEARRCYECPLSGLR